MKENNPVANIEEFRNNAIKEAERMKKALQDKGMDETTINEWISSFMKSIEDTIKNQENERN